MPLGMKLSVCYALATANHYACSGCEWEGQKLAPHSRFTETVHLIKTTADLIENPVPEIRLDYDFAANGHAKHGNLPQFSNAFYRPLRTGDVTEVTK
jgi:hypothetical protein